MKNRLKRYFLYLFIRYVPSTSRIAKNEAKLLAQYVFDNFTEEERIIIVSEMKNCLAKFIENQINQKQVEVDKEVVNLENLRNNLNKLISK